VWNWVPIIKSIMCERKESKVVSFEKSSFL
jgi:hypothetical protein